MATPKADTFLKKVEELDKELANAKQAAIEELRGIIQDAEDKLRKITGDGKRTRKSGERKCGNCGEIGHNSRSCLNPKKKAKAA